VADDMRDSVVATRDFITTPKSQNLRSAPSGRLKQSDESSLLEMTIAGECFHNSPFLHDRKADAVNHSPVFIRTLTRQLPALPANLGGQLRSRPSIPPCRRRLHKLLPTMPNLLATDVTETISR
jgi:hypothetical protein